MISKSASVDACTSILELLFSNYSESSFSSLYTQYLLPDTFMKITIIGGGNLGVAIAEGMVESQFITAENITVTRRKLSKISHLGELGIQLLSSNSEACRDVDIVILAVKPYQAKAVLVEILPSLSEKQILVSVITGLTLAEMTEVVGVSKCVLFRAMPNTAIAIRESMTCISTKNATATQSSQIIDLFEQLGKAVVIEEELMEAATVLGACGIAYALRFVRAASQGGIEIGFGAEIAQLIASQTVKGASDLLLKKGQHPEYEIDKVTTPKGCTIAGLNEMEHRGFSSALIKGVITSYKKIEKN
ncbi:MAG: pyrroline-5-carboxylate reductase [Flammeovirgaceae bacterium]|jgi:pyrroline-5-carboxylate reductase